MRTEKQIQRKANELLRSAGVVEPPVDVISIAVLLGATIRHEITKDDISGALHRREDGPVIGVNALHSQSRQRFTIAHEIGHLILHKHESVFIDRVYRRDSQSSEALDPVEIEANKFAAALLMPKDLISSAEPGKGSPLSSDDVEELARRFAVSQQAMTFRLENLGVPLQLS